MLKAILEVATGLFIVVGSVTVVYVVYTTLHGAVYDPSLPHGELWRLMFGATR